MNNKDEPLTPCCFANPHKDRWGTNHSEFTGPATFIAPRRVDWVALPPIQTSHHPSFHFMPSTAPSSSCSEPEGCTGTQVASRSSVDPGLDPFIIATSLAKPDPKTRKFIRSHVMRGKNAGKFRPKCSPGWQAASPKDRMVVRRPPTSRPGGGAAGAGVEGWALITPQRIVSELSLLGFGGDMQPYVLRLVYRGAFDRFHQLRLVCMTGFFSPSEVFTVIKPDTYGLQDVTNAHLYDHKMFCFANLTNHPGILHATIFAVQAYHDLALGHTYGRLARVHLGKALFHLQRSLDNRNEAIELSTIAVVAALATAAIIARDVEAAVAHMDGLRRMVELRGGFQSFGSDSMIEHKARR